MSDLPPGARGSDTYILRGARNGRLGSFRKMSARALAWKDPHAGTYVWELALSVCVFLSYQYGLAATVPLLQRTFTAGE
jgi:hypothetical protein